MPEDSLSISLKIKTLRFLGYVGVQFAGVLVAFLVFKLTGSAVWAGLSLVIEWVPKLLLYLSGGALINSLCRWKAHVLVEALRLFAFIGMIGAALEWLPWWAVTISAALYQCTNAISNILFEGLVTHAWPRAEHSQGHSQVLRMDMASGIVVICLGLATQNVIVLLGIGFLFQVLALASVLLWSKALHPEDPPQPLHPLVILKTTINAAKRVSPQLAALTTLSFSVNLPLATLSSALPFFLSGAFPALEIGPRTLALYSLVRLLSTLGSLYALEYFLKRGVKEGKLAALALIGIFAAVLIATFSTGLIAVICLLAIGVFTSLYSPWARALRQRYIPEEPQIRMPLTGLLISVEALSYLAGAAILAISAGELHLMVVLTGIPLVLAVPLWLKVSLKH